MKKSELAPLYEVFLKRIQNDSESLEGADWKGVRDYLDTLQYEDYFTGEVMAGKGGKLDYRKLWVQIQLISAKVGETLGLARPGVLRGPDDKTSDWMKRLQNKNDYFGQMMTVFAESTLGLGALLFSIAGQLSSKPDELKTSVDTVAKIVKEDKTFWVLLLSPFLLTTTLGLAIGEPIDEAIVLDDFYRR